MDAFSGLTCPVHHHGPNIHTMFAAPWRNALAALVLVTLPAANAALAAPPPVPQRWVPGEILVQPRTGAPAAAVEQALEAHSGRAFGTVRGLSVLKVKVPPQAELAVARALARHPAIEFAEVNAIVDPAFVPDDPSYVNQWHLPKIGGPAAWDDSRGANVVIAILDTGVEPTHLDLAAQLVSGWNSVLNNTDTVPIHDHGTKVAGTAAALADNSLGVASVAWNAWIMPIKVSIFSDGSASLAAIADGLVWAADHGADVANISYASVASSSTIAEAAAYMQSQGGVVVVAAGNTGTDLGYQDSPYSIAVSATTSADTKASWSSYGAFVDVSAPGASILTTTIGGSYASVSGTSFSSPVTAGVVALIMAANPNLNPLEVEHVLEDTAVDLGTAGFDALYGHGRVDAAAAVLTALEMIAPDTQAPSVTIDSPTGGTVSGLVPVDVTASDNVGVEYVELAVDGVTLARDEVAPYAFAWDSTAFPDGAVTLTALAADAAGNNARSEPVSVTVDNTTDTDDTTPPAVAIATPNAGDTVSGIVAVGITGSDDVGVVYVELLANGVSVGRDELSPYGFAWDSTAYEDGPVTLSALAADAAGNVGHAEPIGVAVDNVPDSGDTTPPSVAFSSPADGDTVSKNIEVRVAASDESGLARIDLFIGGTLVATGTASPLSYRWNTRKSPPGVIVLRAEATDLAGNTQASEISVTVE